ncbi:HAD family hydrolase [Methyloligella sp. 2.7D]|uniref:HAD family hydrolase n=1 Tax=unclassified Methyloligella TaxID=2625955 RepID=UPI00157CC161|nr:HAD family hydrolase [Methyloligella sp. GL2]QKP75989.1 HAD family hydrolase [Methyloligella sp. GL2]
MAEIQGLLFDKDGTLLDFFKTWTPICRDLATEAAGGDEAVTEALLLAGGLDPETETFASGSIFQGAGIENLIACFTEVMQEATPEDLREMITRHLREGGGKYAVIMEGVREEIVVLQEAGYRLGIATNDTHGGLHASMGRCGDLIDFFPFLAACDSGYGAKPDPAVGLAFAESIGAPPSACAIIGDSVHDLEMGRRAGFGLRIGVLTGPSPREDLEPHADLVLDSMLELSTFLAELDVAKA